MGKRQAERQTVIAASPHACFAALLDYESFPDWQRAVRCCAVLARDAHGRGKRVAFELVARARALRCTLEYGYEEPHLITWRHVEGDPKGAEGELVLEDRGDGTTLATSSLRLEPGAWLALPASRALTEHVMQRAIEDLRGRYERAS